MSRHTVAGGRASIPALKDAEVRERPSLKDHAGFYAVVLVVMVVAIFECLHLPHETFDGYSFDGFRYLGGTYSVLERGRYEDLDGTPQRTWPPGTSLLYAAASQMTGRKPESLITAIDLTCYLLLLVALAMLFRAGARRWQLAAIGFAAVALNLSLISFANKFQSDLPALAALTSALALMVHAISRRSQRWTLLAFAVLSAAVLCRFAMIATVPVAAIAGFVVWRRWRGVVLAMLIPLPMLLALRLLAPHSGAKPGLRIARLPLTEDWQGMKSLAYQIFPSQLGAAAVFLLVALLFVVGWNVGTGDRNHGDGEVALVVNGGWILAYSAFLVAAQIAWVAPLVRIDLRILIPLYPSLVLLLIAGADRMMDGGYRVLPGIAAASVVLALLRALHPLFVPPRAASPFPCVSRDEIARAIVRLAPDIEGDVASNSQGVAWFALRRPVSNVEKASRQSSIVYVDSKGSCTWATESDVPLPPEVRIVARSGNVVLARR